MRLKEGDMVYAIYNENEQYGKRQYRPAIIEDVVKINRSQTKYKCYHLDMSSMEDVIDRTNYYQSAYYLGSELKTVEDLKVNEEILVIDFGSVNNEDETPLVDATFLRMGDKPNECIVKIKNENKEELIFVWNLAILFN